MLKQKNFSPLSDDEQFVLIYAGLNGFIDDIDIKNISKFEKFLLEENKKYELFDEDATITEKQEQLNESLVEMLEYFNNNLNNE